MTHLKDTLERIDAAYKATGYDGEQFDKSNIRRPQDFNLDSPTATEELELMRLLVNAWPRLRTALADSVTPGGDEHTAAMQDLSYANGFRAGWNAGAACQNGGDEAANKRLESVMRRHSEALQFLKEARNLGPAQPEAGAGLREQLLSVRDEIKNKFFFGVHHENAEAAADAAVELFRDFLERNGFLALGAADGWRDDDPPQNDIWILIDNGDDDFQYEAVKWGVFPYDAERDISAWGNDHTYYTVEQIKRWKLLFPSEDRDG